MYSQLHLLPNIEASNGGIASSTISLCDATNQQGRHSAQVYELYAHRGSVTHATAGRPISKITHFRSVRGDITAWDVVHIHGLWQPRVISVTARARYAKVPYIISAHGMLDPWALKQKRWKKSLYATFVERRLLAGAACLRALTPQEADEYRRFGLKNPIAIIPNGVTPQPVAKEIFLSQFPFLRPYRLILYMGRFDKRKESTRLSRHGRESRHSIPTTI